MNKLSNHLWTCELPITACTFWQILIVFINSKYHIICLSESWLKPQVSNGLISLNGYRLLRCNCTGKIGGGVAVYILDMFQAMIVRKSESAYCERPEYLMVEISIRNNSNLFLAVVYRSPHCACLQDFLNEFMDLPINYKHSIIFGDFNAELSSHSFDSEQILSLVSSSNYHLVPYSSTHHTHAASTLLDLCIVDDIDKFINYVMSVFCQLMILSALIITSKSSKFPSVLCEFMIFVHLSWISGWVWVYELGKAV